MKLFLLQTRSEIKRIFRNPYFVFWSLFMPLVFYFVFTNVFNTDMPDQGLWDAHFLMSIAAFSVMGSSIMTLGIRLVEERTQGWSIYLSTTPLPPAAYFASKMAGQSAVHVFSILFIFFAGYLINGVRLSPAEWVLGGVWILLASLPFLALGVLIGAMRRVDTASGVSNLIYLGLAITGGMWMPMEVLPEMLQAVGKWLPAYSYGNGAWEIIRGHAPEWRDMAILTAYLLLFMALAILIRNRQEAMRT
ncbi:ABC transporter permease [Bhargavaea beijingensis]|uniref:ABC-2 type transport system permease protein n=1 Tax=Bhargavaea beijingensis TaxID=426756 RepID=A0A1G7GCQ7_9BACL|nr:ABC transporter permease [Bhargavaea beijingensis]MCW1929004.1 ABC transporter permease [Bhargavaea beijingensis]SDE85914.1 ABC-2 type transport system permease protein [Bhargavaea beijingensis]